MENEHIWTTYQKGRMKIKACACCGQMHLASNAHKSCDPSEIKSSPLILAGYKVVSHLLQTAA